MKQTHSIKLTFISALFLMVSASTGYAEKLNKFWQEPRDHYNKLADDACDGNGKALREVLVAAIKDEHPVAQLVLAWVYHTERCVFAEDDRREATELERLSANAGYPVAQRNYAISLIEGLGANPDPDLGAQFLERAIAAGYGSAAATYAEYLLEGEYLPKDREKAQEYYKLAQELGADQSALDGLVKLLADGSQDAPLLIASDSWGYEDGEASRDLIQDGRLVAQAVFGFNEYSRQYYYGLTLVSEDPIIHFMGASISTSGGAKTELNIGSCGGTNCLDRYNADNGELSSQVEMTLPSELVDETIRSFQSGEKITFRYQTKSSASNNNYIKLPFGLEGSRKAVNKVQAWAAGGQENEPDTNQISAPTPAQNEAPDTTSTTYYEGDAKHGDIHCPAVEMADFPPSFYTELPGYLQEAYTLGLTKRLRPASAKFLENAGTSIWTFGAYEHLVMYKGGRAIAVRAGSANGAEQKYEGTWGISAKGITVRVAGNPSYGSGNQNYSCKGGTMALDTMSAPGIGPGSYKEWKGCTIMTICDEWHDKTPSKKRANVRMMRLVEWSPGKLPISQMKWVEEAIKP